MDMYQKRKMRAEKKSKQDDSKVFPSVSINWYPGHMLKTKKQIIEDLKLIDVVVEIRDARIPVSSQNPDIKKIIEHKKKLVILNKSDLAEEKETSKWIEFFEKQNVVAIASNSNLGKGANKCLQEIEKLAKEDLDKAASKGRTKKNIRIMILGIPNVGKSSFINRLLNRKTTVVGNKPGVTKQKQWVRIGTSIELLDTPGVLWPKFEDESVALNLAYVGAIKDELIPKSEVAYSLLKYLFKNYKNNLIERYKLTDEEINSIIPDELRDETVCLMELIAKKRGAILSKDEVDYEKIAGILLTDFRSGKLGRITLEKVNG